MIETALIMAACILVRTAQLYLDSHGSQANKLPWVLSSVLSIVIGGAPLFLLKTHLISASIANVVLALLVPLYFVVFKRHPIFRANTTD